MQIIDSHCHYSKVAKFMETSRKLSYVDYSYDGLTETQLNNEVVGSIAMGVTETTRGRFPDKYSPNPMGADLTEKRPPNLYRCLGINPTKLAGNPNGELAKVEEEMANPKVVGLKLYPGYYPFSVTDPVYQPVLTLAQRIGLPVVVHCGDTFSQRGLLRYAHPIHINQVAIKYEDVRFVIAHFGNPWTIDAGIILSNNPNVYADLAGLAIGSERELSKFREKSLLLSNIRAGIEYSESYDKILFGSDWPLVQLSPYIELIKELIPGEYHHKVFFQNALHVFSRLSPLLSQKNSGG